MLANLSSSTVDALEASVLRRPAIQADAHRSIYAIPIVDGLCAVTSRRFRSGGTSRSGGGSAPGARSRIILALLGLVLTSGCAVEPFRLELPANHPANAAAEEAPVPPPTSLAASDADPFVEAAASPKQQTQGHQGHQMQGHQGHQM